MVPLTEILELSKEVENESLKASIIEKESLYKELEEKYNQLVQEQKQEQLPRIKATDNLDQKDYARMNEIQSEINDLRQKMTENSNVILEMTEGILSIMPEYANMFARIINGYNVGTRTSRHRVMPFLTPSAELSGNLISVKARKNRIKASRIYLITKKKDI